MPLSVGEKLGPYEILAPIGKGGMGEVYRAHDFRLNRDVAIKISSAEFTERFSREARLIASLNHPNICTLHDVGPNYLVMELIEGSTLAERITLGPIPWEESLNVVVQLVAALEAAHEKGIIHRDLKPGNIKIKPDGSVKVLDFGLAKIGGTPAPLSENSPTISMAATQAGVILGTAAYMAPEQARGKPVDKRADIWAFGVVLYEMLAGERPFKGEDLTEVLAAVVKEQPDLNRVPAQVRPILQHCLEKDPKKRLRDISGVSLLLERTPPAKGGGGRWPWVVAVSAVAIIAAIGFWGPWRTQTIPEVVRFEVRPPDGVAFNNTRPATSPDGRSIAYIMPAGVGQVWIRALDSLVAHALRGGENAYGTLFWSPDSRSIAFSGRPPDESGTSQSRNLIRRVAITGGPPQTILEAVGLGGGGDWNSDGVILLGGRGIQRVLETGGEPISVTVLEASRGETFHRFPSFLPDGKHFLYLRASNKPEIAGIYIGSLDTKPDQQDLKRLLAADSGAIYAPSPGSTSGYLLFLRQGSLMAQPFDPDRLELSGEAHLIAQAGYGGPTVGGYFSASNTGVLAYRSLPERGTGTLRIAVLDRHGKLVTSTEEPGTYDTPAFSPDGSQVAVMRSDGSNGEDIWLTDLGRNTTTKFTFDTASDTSPVWSPDAKYIAFSSDRDGPRNLYRKVSRGAGTEELLYKSEDSKTPTDWSRDGHFLLFTNTKNGSSEIWVLPLEGPEGKPGKAVPYLKGASLANARFSPDRRFVAFQSNATGRNEIYVQTFPDPAKGRWQISTVGGSLPRWRRDGKELYFVDNRNLMAVDVNLNSFDFNHVPKPLAQFPNGPPSFDVDAKGERFVKASVLVEKTDAPPPPITIVLNWQTEIKK